MRQAQTLETAFILPAASNSCLIALPGRHVLVGQRETFDTLPLAA
jgi:hypothetical protein